MHDFQCGPGMDLKCREVDLYTKGAPARFYASGLGNDRDRAPGAFASKYFCNQSSLSKIQ